MAEPKEGRTSVLEEISKLLKSPILESTLPQDFLFCDMITLLVIFRQGLVLLAVKCTI